MQVPIKNSGSSSVPHPQNIKCINIAAVFNKENLVFLIINKNFSFIFLSQVWKWRKRKLLTVQWEKCEDSLKTEIQSLRLSLRS